MTLPGSLRSRQVSYLMKELPCGSDRRPARPRSRHCCGAGIPPRCHLQSTSPVRCRHPQCQSSSFVSGFTQATCHSGSQHDIAAAAAMLLRCRDGHIGLQGLEPIRGVAVLSGPMDAIESRRWWRKGTTASASAMPRSWDDRQELRSRQVSYLMKELPCGSDLLDLGCGAGTPTTKHLAEQQVDISQRQVERARRDIPEATFKADDVAAAAAMLLRCRDSLLLHHSRPSGRTPDLFRSIAAWPDPKFFSSQR